MAGGHEVAKVFFIAHDEKQDQYLKNREDEETTPFCIERSFNVAPNKYDAFKNEAQEDLNALVKEYEHKKATV